MSIEKLWNNHELYFYHEFVNDEKISKSKRSLLKQDRGHYFIHNDFTIYQEKSKPFEEVNELDFKNNYGTFIVILYNLPPNKVEEFIDFHYDKYPRNKKNFLDFLYHSLKGSKSTQGGKEIKPPEQKNITIKWCENKIEEFTLSDKTSQKSNNKEFRKITAKFIALKERVINIQKIHKTVPADIFDSIVNQFFKDTENLKSKFSELEDFVPSNYSDFKAHYETYFSLATKALIADISFFIDFLENIEPEDIDTNRSEEGIFFSGQNFDALYKFNELISKANSEIILLDNYLDENTLEVLGKNSKVKCKVLTLKRSLSGSLKAFIEAFNKQHNNLEVKTSSAFHDRFLIIDKKEFYHFGASIKDAGNKGFMFSQIEESFIKVNLLKEIEKEWQK